MASKKEQLTEAMSSDKQQGNMWSFRRWWNDEHRLGRGG